MTRKTPQVQLIAHNIRSAENVGALFRTCDSIGVIKLWLTGYTPTPRHRKVAKTALGAETSVAWEFVADIIDVFTRLRNAEVRIVALEIANGAKNLVDYAPPSKIALLIGNEVEGLTPSLLALCDDIIAITQHGVKESLNVSVAAGIATHWLMNSSWRS